MRIFRSPIEWFEVGEFYLIGPKEIYEGLQKVRLRRDCSKTAQSRKKPYANNIKKDINFMVGNMVYFNILPMKGEIIFGKRRRLNLCMSGKIRLYNALKCFPMNSDYLLSWLYCIWCSMCECSKNVYVIQCVSLF